MPVFFPQQKRHLSVFAPILAWCHDRIRGIVAPPEHERGGLGEVSGVVQDSARSGGGMPDRARYCYDASLLFRRGSFRSIGTSSQATIPCCFASFRDYAHCVEAKDDVCGISRWKVMRPGGRSGSNTAATPPRSTRSARCKTAAGPRDT